MGEQTAARRFLVTGGAGFVGSHLVLALRDRGAEVVVLDNLSKGHRAAVPAGARFVQADLGDTAALDAVMADGPWTAVFHFAGWTQVGESMRLPGRYFEENATKGFGLIEACARHGIDRLVFSSTANLFAGRGRDPIRDDAPVDPQSPYGESKWMVERALYWAGVTRGLRSARLRYFNAAGADPAGRLGEDHRPETHLIPLVIDAALGRRPPLDIYGGDYPTPDGTCVRDYVHVADLAEAHLLALSRLDEEPGVTWNLGSGTGHSVLEVIRSVERISGPRVPHRVIERRAGDPPFLVAASDRARAAGWRPRFEALDEIVGTAFAWRQAHPDGYES